MLDKHNLNTGFYCVLFKQTETIVY